ncbi:hypothetical protein EDB92DRAFT_566936 [Lactarius akahatsu]|uniref:Uncharacterized protein n=1 Tax=Lactarius akahatsu TaxID=416441 RepID=A0AAD4LHG6_9AGAM|nr:hypothetical protein EDB92DRAFT_566936 [Lactarius akahatsu]
MGQGLAKCLKLWVIFGDTHVPRVEHDVVQCRTPFHEFLNVFHDDGPSLAVPFLSIYANSDALQRTMRTSAQHPIRATDEHVELLERRESTDDLACLERRHARPQLKHAHLPSERLRERLECLRARRAAQHERLERGEGPVADLARDERARGGGVREDERAERAQGQAVLAQRGVGHGACEDELVEYGRGADDVVERVDAACARGVARPVEGPFEAAERGQCGRVRGEVEHAAARVQRAYWRPHEHLEVR